MARACVNGGPYAQEYVTALSRAATRWSGVWTQQGNKAGRQRCCGKPRQGMSVALSAENDAAIVGGLGDNPSDRIEAL
jgi:hypothetical protein